MATFTTASTTFLSSSTSRSYIFPKSSSSFSQNLIPPSSFTSLPKPTLSRSISSRSNSRSRFLVRASDLPLVGNVAPDFEANAVFDRKLVKHGSVYKLAFGAKAFVVVSDPIVVRYIVRENAFSYDKHGSVYKLAFGPKAFIVASDPIVARYILRENAFSYDKETDVEKLQQRDYVNFK